MIADVQPVINGQVLTSAGAFQPLTMPVLLDCPVLFQGGGGASMTFPIKAGDECLVIFSSRCIDAWWSQGFKPPIDGQPNPAMSPPDLRMHNLSDGFVLVGVRSSPHSYAVDTANVEIRSDDGQAFIKLNPTTHAISMTAPGGIDANGLFIDADGNLITPANVTVGTGATGTFSTPTGQTVDVLNGIVTNIY
jgi:hypothetical protein